MALSFKGGVAPTVVAADSAQQMNDLLAMTCHELRTPMSSAHLALQLATRHVHALQTCASSPQARTERLGTVQAFLATALRSLERMACLTNDITQFAHAEDVELALTPCDLRLMIADVVQEQQHLTPHRTIHWRQPSASIAFVQADEARIRQVLTNLLTNALRYSPEDAPVVVRLHQRRDWVYVAVCDQGYGIPMEERKRIWQRYYRSKAVPEGARTQHGLGLGLPICRMIIAAHQGRLGLRSTVGKGSIFWFALHVDGQEAEEIPMREHAA